MDNTAISKTISTKICNIINSLSKDLIERDEALKLLLLAALSGEHILLLGPPGTAKSEIARRIQFAFNNGNYFERLLTRFSVPEELFGPLSIKALENDQYKRLTKNYLPDASIAFIDEIFKANSAILNTLLTLLNEREFDNGDCREKTPLITVVAASNELPDDDELEALYDRFLFRLSVNPVSEDGFEKLLKINENVSNTKIQPISSEELSTLKALSTSIKLSPDVIYTLKSLRQYLQENDIYVSDRRWTKIVKMLKVSALTNDRAEVSIWDCWLLQHCLWETPEQKNMIFTWYKQHIGTSEIIDITRINKLVHIWEKTLEEEKKRTVPLYNDKGEKLYCTPQGETTIESGQEYLVDREGEPLYLSPIDNENPGNTDRTNNNNGVTRLELKEKYFDDYYQQRHIDGKWVTIDDYINNIDNRFTKRFQYDACNESAKYSQDHIADRCKELTALVTDIEDYQSQIKSMLTSAAAVLNEHLWVDKSFTDTAKEVLEGNLKTINNVVKHLDSIRTGFKSLPTTEQKY